MDSDKRLRWSRRLSFVPRWSIVPTIRQQTVDAHCFHVAHTSLWLLEFHAFGDVFNFKASVVECALDHDISEAAEGDAPTPSKAPKDPKAMTDVQILVKCADILEAMAFVFEEIQFGNTHGMSALLADLNRRFLAYWPHFKLKRNIAANEMVMLYKAQIVPPEGELSHPGLEPA